MTIVLFADLVATSETVGMTPSRTAKRDALAHLLRALAADEVAPAVGMLTGEVRQGRIGVGWATITSIAATAAAGATLSVNAVDGMLTELVATTGTGSVRRRADLLTGTYAAATRPEQEFLSRLLLGELRQGAQEGVMVDAIAVASDVPVASVRRGFMLAGDLGRTAEVALAGGRGAVDAIGLSVLTPVRPMLASTADSVEAALVGTGDPGSPMAVEWKLDGARIQVHRAGDDVSIFTRNLNDITSRLPAVVDMARALPATSFVLDGEILGMSPDDGSDGHGDNHIPPSRPQAFQDTMSSMGRERPGPGGAVLSPWFFDILHRDGDDLIDEAFGVRDRHLREVTGSLRIPGIITADPIEAQAFLDATVAAGHEGVMVKDLDGPYAAGRRGKSWRKVKPVHVVDLVVLAAEWGSGRRRGWLSNLHLGARDPADANRFVMVGKTFKGLTDALLTWQTEALLEREIGRDGHTVHVRPELVVEIGLDGVQVSTRYPGGIALRFARVRRYRDDKTAADADTIEALQRFLPLARRPAP